MGLLLIRVFIRFRKKVETYNYVTDESNLQMKWCFFHNKDAAPFHKLCNYFSVTTIQIDDHLTENRENSVAENNTIHVTTPLHMMSTNPHVPNVVIAALLDSFQYRSCLLFGYSTNNALRLCNKLQRWQVSWNY